MEEVVEDTADTAVADEVAEEYGAEENSESGNSLMNVFFGNPDNAWDASKKADVNNLIMAIETYNNDYMEYPQKTACVDQMDEFDEYLFSADRIFEEGVKAVFETEDGSLSITCEGGHLYQSFGEGAYMFWTTVRNEENGNMQYLVTNQADVVTGNEGRYFVNNHANSFSMEMLPFEGEDADPVVKTGVSRGVSRTAE